MGIGTVGPSMMEKYIDSRAFEEKNLSNGEIFVVSRFNLERIFIILYFYLKSAEICAPMKFN